MIKMRVRRIVFAFVLMSAWMSLAHGDTSSVLAQAGTGTILVAISGTDAPGCGSVASPCRTIQYAVNQVPVGGSGTIQVASGTYTFNASTDVCTGAIGGTTAVVCFYNKQLRILGGYTTSDWSVANPTVNVTIIDGQNSYRGVRVQKAAPTAPATSLRMEGFTIQNGLAQGASSGSDAQTFTWGGGLFAEHTPLTLRNMVFKNNRAVGGSTNQSYGGIGSGGALAINSDANQGPSSPALLEWVTFDSNQAIGGTGIDRGGVAHGGALFTYYVSVTGNYITFTNNKAIAASANGSGRANGLTADALGGAMSAEIFSTVTLRYVTATGNQALAGNAPNGDGGGGWGGAFQIEGATFTLLDADVRNNLAQGGNGKNPSTTGSIAEGGAISSVGYYSSNPNDGPPAVRSDAIITLNRSVFVNNTAKAGNGTINAGAVGGGAVALTYSLGTHQITNSVFADNLADIGTGTWVGGGGGALWTQGVVVNVVHSTFSANRLGNAAQTAGAQGLAIILAGPWPQNWVTTGNISYSIISDHTSIVTQPTGGRAALQATPGTTANLNLGLYANNTKDDNRGDASAWRGTLNGLATMLSASSAGYIAPGTPNYNYHIRSDSAAKDKATGSTTPDDMDRESRPYPSGGVSDIGADEFQPFAITAIPGNGSVYLDWSIASRVLAGIVSSYDLGVTCGQGANPPNEVGCGQTKNLPGQTNFTLTGLTTSAQYSFSVAARDAQGNALTNSGTTTVVIPSNFLYLPLVIR